jgi:hypothetical protein
VFKPEPVAPLLRSLISQYLGIESEQFAQIIDGERTINQPAAVGALHDRRLARFGQRSRGLADHGPEQVVERDQAFDVAVFIDHQRERGLGVAEILEQVHAARGGGNE